MEHGYLIVPFKTPIVLILRVLMKVADTLYHLLLEIGRWGCPKDYSSYTRPLRLTATVTPESFCEKEFAVRMSLLSPNQLRQNTEGAVIKFQWTREH